MSITPADSVEIIGACRGSTPKYPSLPGTTTISTSRESTRRSGDTSSNFVVSAIARYPSIRRSRAGSGRLGRHLARLLDRFLDAADHVERRFRQVVVLAVHDRGEALDGVLERHQLARAAGEHLGHEEGLRQEALDLAGPRHRQPVLFRQLVDSEARRVGKKGDSKCR